MARVKVKKKSTWVDMTAMCDMTFLLLTFFMLTSNFTKKEAIQVSTPASVSEIKIKETDLMQVLVDKEGKVFFGLDKQEDRIAVLKDMGEQYKVSFTDKELKDFSLIPSFGVPMEMMKAYLAIPSELRDMKENAVGIPADSLNNQFREWVRFSRKENKALIIAIKADRDTPYPQIKGVMSTLQDLRENKYHLITSLKTGSDN
ncbi:MAG: biopolymer transporter ExbD [Bacteroidales bacterium]|jgi:biopolymer transport protein ExbD|nr:biopolymer transporter ExbD [Bacteroidales bacterium]